MKLPKIEEAACNVLLGLAIMLAGTTAALWLSTLARWIS